MKIKFIEIGNYEKILHGSNVVNVGDIIDLPKARADYYVASGKAEKVASEPKVKKEKFDE